MGSADYLRYRRSQSAGSGGRLRNSVAYLLVAGFVRRCADQPVRLVELQFRSKFGPATYNEATITKNTK